MGFGSEYAGNLMEINTRCAHRGISYNCSRGFQQAGRSGGKWDRRPSSLHAENLRCQVEESCGELSLPVPENVGT